MAVEDWCGRCLVFRDASVGFAAVTGTGDDKRYIGNSPGPNVRGIAAWADRMMEQTGGDARFEYATMPDMLLPVTTWYGDKVCVGHLWTLTEMEMNRQLWRPRA